jgi:hypothetical protein
LLHRLVFRLPLRLYPEGVELAFRGFENRRRLARGPALPDRLQLRGKALVFPLHEGELVADDRNLALEQRRALPVPPRKLIRDPTGLRVTDLGRQASPPLRIREVLLLGGQLPLGGGEGIAVDSRGDLELYQGFVQPRSLRAAVRPAGEEAIEARAKFVETHRPNVTARMYLWESSMRTLAACLLSLTLLGGCAGGKSGNYGCGFATVAGQSLILEQFNRPGAVLAAPPPRIPESLPVRIALGPVFRSVTGRDDTMLVVGVEGPLPATPAVGFGVLVATPDGQAQGVLLYEGSPIQGAPILGHVNSGDRNLPLIGLRLDLARFQNASCPIFPDSLRR